MVNLGTGQKHTSRFMKSNSTVSRHSGILLRIKNFTEDTHSAWIGQETIELKL